MYIICIKNVYINPTCALCIPIPSYTLPRRLEDDDDGGELAWGREKTRASVFS